jgi:hypothetical protein
MSKKNFKDSPALAYIKPQNNAQEHTQEDTQEVDAKNYVKTQGRRGQKKPRINLAFNSEDFLDQIRVSAEREGKSITQFVNDAVAYYLEKVNKD